MPENKPSIIQNRNPRYIEHYLPHVPWLLQDIPTTEKSCVSSGSAAALEEQKEARALCTRARSDASGVTYSELPFTKSVSPVVPDMAFCEAIWDAYDMPEHIRSHCSQVTRAVSVLGELLIAKGAVIDMPMTLAGALLHDIAKIFTIRNGGNHAQIGASIVLRETRHHRIAQMVYHHVYWPWPIDADNDWTLPVLMLAYADKRVRHDSFVTIEDRFTDLLDRYGKTQKSRDLLTESHEQGIELEKALGSRAGVDLNEYSFDGGRLVW